MLINHRVLSPPHLSPILANSGPLSLISAGRFSFHLEIVKESTFYVRIARFLDIRRPYPTYLTAVPGDSHTYVNRLCWSPTNIGHAKHPLVLQPSAKATTAARVQVGKRVLCLVVCTSLSATIQILLSYSTTCLYAKISQHQQHQRYLRNGYDNTTSTTTTSPSFFFFFF